MNLEVHPLPDDDGRETKVTFQSQIDLSLLVDADDNTDPDNSIADNLPTPEAEIDNTEPNVYSTEENPNPPTPDPGTDNTDSTNSTTQSSDTSPLSLLTKGVRSFFFASARHPKKAVTVSERSDLHMPTHVHAHVHAHVYTRAPKRVHLQSLNEEDVEMLTQAPNEVELWRESKTMLLVIDAHLQVQVWSSGMSRVGEGAEDRRADFEQGSYA